MYGVFDALWVLFLIDMLDVFYLHAYKCYAIAFREIKVFVSIN